jgi:hypothetical protein
MYFAKPKQAKNITTKAMSARMSRERSSMRCSISGAREDSISSSTAAVIGPSR